MTYIQREVKRPYEEMIRSEYYKWMTSLVQNEEFSRGENWDKLFRALYDAEFIFTIPMDSNRAADGCDLRYRFGHEYGYPSSDICDALDSEPCSVLEMMVALALRCEEHITGDPEIGDRTAKWFFDMVESLGLADMDDGHFDEDYVEVVIDRLSTGDYDYDGRGGLFTVPGICRDMRNMEIWYQMMWYLNEIVYKRRNGQ